MRQVQNIFFLTQLQIKQELEVLGFQVFALLAYINVSPLKNIKQKIRNSRDEVLLIVFKTLIKSSKKITVKETYSEETYT